MNAATPSPTTEAPSLELLTGDPTDLDFTQSESEPALDIDLSEPADTAIDGARRVLLRYNELCRRAERMNVLLTIEAAESVPELLDALDLLITRLNEQGMQRYAKALRSRTLLALHQAMAARSGTPSTR